MQNERTDQRCRYAPQLSVPEFTSSTLWWWSFSGARSSRKKVFKSCIHLNDSVMYAFRGALLRGCRMPEILSGRHLTARTVYWPPSFCEYGRVSFPRFDRHGIGSRDSKHFSELPASGSVSQFIDCMPCYRTPVELYNGARRWNSRMMFIAPTVAQVQEKKHKQQPFRDGRVRASSDCNTRRACAVSRPSCTSFVTGCSLPPVVSNVFGVVVPSKVFLRRLHL